MDTPEVDNAPVEQPATSGPHKGDMEIPFVIKTGPDEFADPGVYRDEPMPEEIAAPAPEVAPEVTPEVVADVPTRLKDYRKPTGELDEEAAETALTSTRTELEQAKSQWNQWNELVASDPALKLATLQALKKKGVTLPPDQEALVVAAEKKAPSVQLPTQAQAIAHYDKLVSEGQPGAAQAFWHEYVTKPQLEATAKAVEEQKRQIAEEETKRQRNAQIQQQAQAYKAQAAEAFKAYPTILKADPTSPSGYVIADKVVAAKFNEVNARLTTTDSTILDVLEIALHRCGRLSAAAPKPPAPTTVQGVRKGAPSAGAAKPKLGKGELAQEYVVVERV